MCWYGRFFFKICTANLRSWRASYTVCQRDALMFAWNCTWKNNYNSVLLIYYNSGYIDLSKRRVGQEDIVKCTEKFSNAKHVSTHIKLCLFKNRSVSKHHTPFTTWTEWNFSQKTPPWLGSGISSGLTIKLYSMNGNHHKHGFMAS